MHGGAKMAIQQVQATNDSAVWITLRDRSDLIHSFDLSQEDAMELHKRLEKILYSEFDSALKSGVESLIKKI